MISIVICTYNRVDLIKGCLDSLKCQSTDSSTFEVLVIDNNSTDKTYQLVQNYLDLPNLRLFIEATQGLSNARNRGMDEAKGDYVAFLDDDAHAESHYIENLQKLISLFSDSIDCYGGPILPFYTSPKPEWFKDEYEIRRMRSKAGFEVKGHGFSGSNMIWKKSILTELGGFKPELGIRGDQLILGEETHLFDTLWETRNPRLYYSPELIVYHWVPEYKLKVKYRLKRNLATGLFNARTHKSRNLFDTVYYFFHSLVLVFIGGLVTLIKVPLYRHWQNWIVEQWSPIMIPLGRVIWLLGFHPNVQR